MRYRRFQPRIRGIRKHLLMNKKWPVKNFVGLSRILCKRICKFSHILLLPLDFVYGTQSQGRDSVHFNLYFVYHIHIIFRGRMWKKRLHNLSDTLASTIHTIMKYSRLASESIVFRLLFTKRTSSIFSSVP